MLVQTISGFAQGSFLSRKITLDIPKCSLDVALYEIGKAGCFRFSYDADLIPVQRKVTLKTNNIQVRALLKEILGKDIRPIEIGNHVILIRDRSVSYEKKTFPNIVIMGAILDAFNRNPLKDVTVFEVENKKSAISEENGKYKLVIPTGKKIRSLNFCKSGYADTVIFINQANEFKINVLLRPLLEIIPRLDTRSGLVLVTNIDSLKIVEWIVPRVTSINAQNLEVHTSRTIQASIIPYIGTNWKVTGSITNRVSFNLLAGYTGGLKGFELGSLLNITRKEMSGLQIGGIGNIVGGRANGLQIGGLFNFDLDNFKGVQIAGMLNYAPDTIRGSQISLMTNVANGHCSGAQISLLLNLALKDVRKVQACCLVNYGHNVDGVQFAGLLNIARNHNDGLQIAGIVNYATIVNGVQIGLVNISNTVERGIPIGIFSYVQKGYHLFEVSGNEIFYGNVAFKSGTKRFYSFVQFGIGNDYKLQGSYGIGTIFTLNKKLSMNLDVSAGFVYHPKDTIYHGFLLKANPALEYRFAKHFALFMGPAYNLFVFTKGDPSATSRGLSFYDFYFKSTPNASIQMWIGGVLGARF
ncbi:MAG: carboxypeptidase-like regulatory domain-containing protein [Bacteroidales bacterium]|nr:carboxypeptidase-like regulatory domain-containing protein [Bacteroidales bacterium]